MSASVQDVSIISASVQDVFDSTDLVRLLLSHVSDVEVIGRAATTCHTLRMHAFSDEVMRPVTHTMEPRLVCGATINKDVFSAVCSRAKHRPWWVKAAALCSDTCPSCKQWGARPPLAQVRQLQVRVCDGCDEIFCPAHAANPRCRTRCRACSGEVFCALCEREEHISGTFSENAMPRRIWCKCCLIVCDGQGCGQRVCAAHARSGRCLECLQQDMEMFQIERAAEAHWAAIQ